MRDKRLITRVFINHVWQTIIANNTTDNTVNNPVDLDANTVQSTSAKHTTIIPTLKACDVF
jgi:hypothetical protein